MHLDFPTRPSLLALLAICFASSIPFAHAHEQEVAAQHEAQALAALEERLTFEFLETPLRDVADYLADAADTNVQIDYERLEEIGFDGETPVTLAVRRMPLRSALAHILREYELAYTIRDGAIVITSHEALEEELVERTYPVGDLRMEDSLWPDEDEFDTLLDAIMMSIRPDMWEDVGGPGALEVIDESLVVRQTFPIQTEVKQFLAALRKALRSSQAIAERHPDSAPPITSFWAGASRGKLIHAAAQKKTTFAYIEEPLLNVASDLSAELGINVLLDTRALEDVGIGSDTPVTFRVKHITASAGLSLILDQMDLTWEIRDDALLITTPEEAESRLHLRVCPVLDLVRDPDAQGLGLGDEFNDYDTLIDVLTTTIEPMTWDVVGGPASATTGAYGCLVIAQTRSAFDEIDLFLKAYRQANSQFRKKPDRLSPAIATENSRHQRLRRILAANAKSMTFDDVPLEVVARQVADAHNIHVELDLRGLEWVGLGADELISGKLEGAPLRDSLRRLLKPYEVTWTLRNEVVMLTAIESASQEMTVKLYPIHDLVTRNSDLGVDSRWMRCDQLCDAVTSRLAPDSWEERGGPGSIITPGHHLLVVAQTEEVHEQLQQFLTSLRNEEIVLAEFAPHDPTNRSTNAKGEALFIKNYELATINIEETENLAEIVRSLVETSSWGREDNYSVQASMAGATIVVRHTAVAHRQIQQLLMELDVLPTERHAEGVGGDSGGWSGPPISRLTALSLPASHPENSYGKSVLLQIVRISTDLDESPQELMKEIMKEIEPKSWRHGNVTNMHCFRQQLIIRHSPTTQRKVVALLKQKDAIFKPQPPFGGFF